MVTARPDISGRDGAPLGLKETISVKRIYGLALVCLLLTPIGVAAQARNRRVPAAPARSTPGKTGTLLKRDGADRVAIQITRDRRRD